MVGQRMDHNSSKKMIRNKFFVRYVSYKLPWNVLNRLHKKDMTTALKFSLDNVNANED